MYKWFCVFSMIVSLAAALPGSAEQAEPWESAYVGEDTTGEHVIGYWNGDGEGETVADLSGNGHDGVLEGAVRRPDGRFGGCLESFAGWPVEDVCHRIRIKDAERLSPRGAFTVEMWVCPGEIFETYDEVFIADKKYVAHTDYQWVLEKPDKLGHRYMRVCLGFGQDSDTWWSQDPVPFKRDVWSHIAFSYDGAGGVCFFYNGRSLGASVKPGRGGVCPGDHFLSLGDRVGSYHHGFPGRMDEIRITEGVREFRPLAVAAEYARTAYERMEPAPALRFKITNLRRNAVSGITVTIGIAGTPEKDYVVPELAPAATHVLEYPLDTRLRPDAYQAVVECRMGEGEDAWSSRESFAVSIVARKPPHKMPVVMWGLGGVDSVLENMDTLKEIGFTHCLGLRCDYQRVWEAGTPVNAVSEEELAASTRMLDQAFINDLGIIISLGVGHWLEEKQELLRIDRNGNEYERGNICCNFPEMLPFARNVGASVAQTFGEFPAFEAALINTEVRDGSQLCFHEHDRALYRAATGLEIPEAAVIKNGVKFDSLPEFPQDRVLADDHELLRFYQWFWREGDGWNGFHSAINDGLKSAGRKGFWTFFDPAVRVPPLWGSGGNVDFLSHWTYSYPDPIRIGLCADELFAMAKGGPEGQEVMKMTQIIWYRSQTAPIAEAAATDGATSPWEDYDPDAAYITIAPAHLREAFWTKISRPVKGIMYHGWQSLVPTESKSTYRFTHPETRHALKELTETIVQPLGPTLLQVPAVKSDVAMLESFTASMFAGRGTYGWGGSWGGDAYHILLYAGFQPDIIYEETVLKEGLEGFKVLVLADCDVLSTSVVERIHRFQQAGGVVVGDERLCPAVTPDVSLAIYTRTKQADADKEALLARARTLREQLRDRYRPYVASSSEEALPYRRGYGSSDYLFAINDHREFGAYVGHHGLVMENGLPLSAEFTIHRSEGHVYDLVEHREVTAGSEGGVLRIPVALEPGGGRLWLITEKQVSGIRIEGPEELKRLEENVIPVTVTDDAGSALAAIIPLEVILKDPDRRVAEFSGYYGARDGRQELRVTPAPNDTAGVWTLTARELASGKLARHYFRLRE